MTFLIRYLNANGETLEASRWRPTAPAGATQPLLPAHSYLGFECEHNPFNGRAWVVFHHAMPLTIRERREMAAYWETVAAAHARETGGDAWSTPGLLLLPEDVALVHVWQMDDAGRACAFERYEVQPFPLLERHVVVGAKGTDIEGQRWTVEVRYGKHIDRHFLKYTDDLPAIYCLDTEESAKALRDAFWKTLRDNIPHVLEHPHMTCASEGMDYRALVRVTDPFRKACKRAKKPLPSPP